MLYGFINFVCVKVECCGTLMLDFLTLKIDIVKICTNYKLLKIINIAAYCSKQYPKVQNKRI